jgi:hypothetical protein
MQTTCKIILAASILALSSSLQASENYYWSEHVVPVSTSDSAIVIQLDSTVADTSLGSFFDRHPCLNPSTLRQLIDRRFYRYSLSSGYDYLSADSSVSADSIVERVVPVYLAHSVDELMVTDLVSVRFDPGMPLDSMLAALAAVGLDFQDSSLFVHNLWQVRLTDLAEGSPLEAANSLRLIDGVIRATPTFYTIAGKDSTPSDSYYQNQY